MYKGGESYAGSVAGNEQTIPRGNSCSREPNLRRRLFMRPLPTNRYSTGKGRLLHQSIENSHGNRFIGYVFPPGKTRGRASDAVRQVMPPSAARATNQREVERVSPTRRLG